MGRYYNGDIEGKFWFGVQCSTAPERFGCQEVQDHIDYYIDEDSMDEVNMELTSIINKLGDQLQKFEEFFKNNDSYNPAMLKEAGLNEKLIGEYADYHLGLKIKKCLEENGSCQFTAEV